jgi:DNA-directed RNA polymerase subunit RPC12/RpoP
MLLECDYCGAPLDLIDTTRIATCSYCGRKSLVAALKTIETRTPPGWRPPPVWTPPRHVPAPSLPMAYHRPRARVSPLLPLLGVMIALAVGGVVVFGVAGGAAMVPMLDQAVRWDGTSTFVCAPNETVVLEGKTAKLDGAVIEAQSNCRLTLRKCRFAGAYAVRAGSNVEIVIEQSTLEGSVVAVETGTNTTLRVRAASRLSGREAGVRTSHNAQIELLESTLVSDGTALASGSNAKLDFRSSELRGALALDLQANASGTITATTVTGERKLGSNARIEER